MSDPQQYVADQIGQQASDVLGSPASEADIASSAVASAGLGVTEVDVNALAAQIKAMQEVLPIVAADGAMVPATAPGRWDQLWQAGRT